MERNRDISIGEFQSIKWIEFDNNSQDFFEIDEYLNPTWDFWTLLETECVSECCGIDAFNFWGEQINLVAVNFNKVQLITKLNTLLYKIQVDNHQLIISSKLNNLFEKSVFERLVIHIIKTLETE